MGDNPFDTRYADLQLNRYLHPSLPQHSGHAPQNVLPNGEEEPYTIKCICRFADDDGNTVLCEQCNTWQHIDCYYHPTLVVPDIHKCADCYPRPVDASGAAQRQRRLWEPNNTTDDRRVKRTTNKSQKRAKTRDQTNPPLQQNGWPTYDPMGLELRNGTSWDQPPPAKRPKTNHRNSTSISNSKPLSVLNGSNDVSVFRPPKVPLAECPPDYLSPEFIRLYREPAEFTVAQANTHLNIDVANLLAKWLDDVDAFADVTEGKAQGDVFKYLPTPIEEVEAPIQPHVREEPNATFHGHHPIWKFITVDRDVATGQMIGEIKGTIGRLEDYFADEDNDWERLRHPDHFVFFIPFLPLFIDCRREGTVLRYVRRSCNPNIKIQTIITGKREYRFCFTAMEDIPRGSEITLGWSLRYHPKLRESVSSALDGKKMSPEEKIYLQNSIQTILSHFGDCACEDRDDHPCLMGRFDHRLAAAAPEALPQISKQQSRKRKSLKRTPPRNTHGNIHENNSRAESETLLHDDDLDDSRSTSRSTHSKTSREATPTTTPGRLTAHGLSSELSERDKKKLIQEEMLFNKLEHDKQHGPRKKKRSSGSNLNTPAATNSKTSGRRNSVTSNNNATPAPPVRTRPNEQGTSYFPHRRASDEPSPQPQISHSGNPPMQKPPRPPKPVYVSQGTQTGSVDETCSSTSPSPSQRRSFVPLSRRLLMRCHLRFAQASLPKPPDDVAGEPYNDPVALLDAEMMDVAPELPQQSSITASPSEVDVDMKDASPSPTAVEPAPATPTDPADATPKSPNASQQSLQPSHPPIKPPAPPWPVPQIPLHPPPLPPTMRTNIRSANLHVDLPPVLQTLPSGEAPVALMTSTSSGSAGPQPSTTGPVLSPTVMASALPSSITQPSPLKKKMSLSDYTAKMKAKTPGLERPQTLGEARSTSPAASRPPQLSSVPSIPEHSDTSSADAPSSQGQAPVPAEERSA